MFFKRSNQESNTRPAVKKVSELINTKSHKQKKYISLMLVPSYSAGKTRSLRIPHVVFHSVVICFVIISAVITGLYLRSLHFERQSRNLGESLEMVQTDFAEFQRDAEAVHSDLMEATAQMYDQLNEDQFRAALELEWQERRHRNTLEDIWDYIDEIERQIREFEENRQEILNNLGARSFIPPVADLMRQMESTQDELRRELMGDDFFARHAPLDEDADAIPAVGFMGMGLTNAESSSNLSEEEVFLRLFLLRDELYLEQLFLDNLQSYHQRMEAYLRNYPTLWPVKGVIYSGFGLRHNTITRRTEHHNGIDIPSSQGTAIRAAGGGIVIFSGWNGGYGNTVIIDHGSGITTLYAHNSRNRVHVGQRVSRGDIIADVGSTGQSTGPHLHYEVRIDGTAMDPVAFLFEYFQ
jgi:murein DD-endopeptidase MepM/ murein hydrolase activator NlpD